MGHLGFAATQWIGRQDILGISGQKWGSTKVLHPNCAACLFGKQQCTPIKTKNTWSIPKKEGTCKRNKLQPGELIFCDQYESRLPGRVFGHRGSHLSSQKYRGGALFCDAASGYVL